MCSILGDYVFYGHGLPRQSAKLKQGGLIFAVPGICSFDGGVVDIARGLHRSGRGELEITDVERDCLDRNELRVEVFSRSVARLDAGTQQSLMQAASFVQPVQERQGLMISCPEEIAYRMGFISAAEVEELAAPMGDSSHSAYLLGMVEDDPFPLIDPK